MTATTDAKAIAPTSNAKKAAIGGGADIAALQAHLVVKIGEVQVLLRQIIALTPSGDANLTALNNLLAEFN